MPFYLWQVIIYWEGFRTGHLFTITISDFIVTEWETEKPSIYDTALSGSHTKNPKYEKHKMDNKKPKATIRPSDSANPNASAKRLQAGAEFVPGIGSGSAIRIPLIEIRDPINAKESRDSKSMSHLGLKANSILANIRRATSILFIATFEFNFRLLNRLGIHGSSPKTKQIPIAAILKPNGVEMPTVGIGCKNGIVKTTIKTACPFFAKASSRSWTDNSRACDSDINISKTANSLKCA
jgi:hypothetical protein